MGLGNTNTLNKKSISFIEKTISFVFVFYFAWWVYTQFYPENEDLILAWGLSYWIIAFIGGVAGLFFARYWGGFKSIIGKTILTLSIGLLLQAVGQNITNYYFLNNLEVYPSWADVGFFGSIPFYIYGAWLLTKVTGIRSVLKTTKNKVIAFLIFFIVLFSSYYFLIRGIEYDGLHPLVFVLDFGYPFGEAIFVLLAILNFVLSKGMLGGIMKKPTLLLLGSLVMQYLADYWFSFLSAGEEWVAGGAADLMYLIAYYLMAFAIVDVIRSLRKLQ